MWTVDAACCPNLPVAARPLIRETTPRRDATSSQDLGQPETKVVLETTEIDVLEWVSNDLRKYFLNNEKLNHGFLVGFRQRESFGL